MTKSMLKRAPAFGKVEAATIFGELREATIKRIDTNDKLAAVQSGWLGKGGRTQPPV